jgi:Fe-S cluster assembly ATP-binding protein
MLHIKNLHVSVAKRKILKGINLSIAPGTVHTIMGPNGSGKSTLAYVLSGKDGYIINDGEILFKNKNIISFSPEKRSLLGMFLAFQHPIDIPGVNNAYFLRMALNAKKRFLNKQQVDAIDFLKLIKEKLKDLHMDEYFIHRSINDGFSGGEKKRNEILQMSILEPDIAILDEIDSGLDIDALKIVARGINSIKNILKCSFLLITHYKRLLEYITPDFVHILFNGKIVHSGNKDLAIEIEKKGYDLVKNYL